MVKNLPAVWETRVWSVGWEDSLENRMATHVSIIAWRIPWREEPGGLQSIGSQRVGHDWSNIVGIHTHMHIHNICMGFSDGSVKNPPAMQETSELIFQLGRSPGGGHGNPFQYSCLENPHRQRNLAGYSPWDCTELDMTEQLSTTQHIQSNRRHCIKYSIIWSKQYYELSVIFSIFSREKKMPSRGIN